MASFVIFVSLENPKENFPKEKNFISLFQANIYIYLPIVLVSSCQIIHNYLSMAA